MSRLDAMKKQYTENSTPKKAKTKHVFNKDVYFGTFLDEGVNSAKRQIRILEPKGANESPFVEIMGHKKQIDGKWPTFICPKFEKGEPCPFCEARDILLAEGSAESKEEAKTFSAKKMYIVKVISRENPEHGVKFWRFNHHYKNAGTFDKMDAANAGLPAGEDPYSSVLGRDMIISITKDGKNSVVTGINYNMSQTPLSEDAEQSAAWLEAAHAKDWTDGIFSIKPYDYLEIIVRGGTPVWQRNENGEEGGHYVDKDTIDNKPAAPAEAHDTELSMGVANANAETAPVAESAAPESAAPVATETVAKETAPAPVAETVTPTEPAKVDEEEDDDLPF